MQSLLIAFMDPPAGAEAEFNAWYDQEHVPNRLALDGFLSGRRYSAVADQGPRYMALYELESADVLHGDGYRRLVEERSERERDMLARIPLLDRRVLELVEDGPAWSDDPPYQMTVAMSPTADQADDFVAWYRQEHIRMLLNVPGWRRVRLFRQVEGDGPSFMAVHELESPDIFVGEAYQAAVSTPWRYQIRDNVTRHERHVFKLWRPAA